MRPPFVSSSGSVEESLLALPRTRHRGRRFSRSQPRPGPGIGFDFSHATFAPGAPALLRLAYTRRLVSFPFFSGAAAEAALTDSVEKHDASAGEFPFSFLFSSRAGEVLVVPELWGHATGSLVQSRLVPLDRLGVSARFILKPSRSCARLRVGGSTLSFSPFTPCALLSQWKRARVPHTLRSRAGSPAAAKRRVVGAPRLGVCVALRDLVRARLAAAAARRVVRRSAASFRARRVGAEKRGLLHRPVATAQRVEASPRFAAPCAAFTYALRRPSLLQARRTRAVRRV